MPNDHVPATDTGLPKTTKTLEDCHRDAVMLGGLIEGVDLLENEGIRTENARVALLVIALERVNQLASDLDKLSIAESAKRRAAA